MMDSGCLMLVDAAFMTSHPACVVDLGGRRTGQ